jgi:predicted RND superfamily exporter protein
VLTLGVTTCTLTSLIFLPALLALLRRGDPVVPALPASAAEAAAAEPLRRAA